jgi:hypothetical protein
MSPSERCIPGGGAKGKLRVGNALRRSSLM